MAPTSPGNEQDGGGLPANDSIAELIERKCIALGLKGTVQIEVEGDLMFTAYSPFVLGDRRYGLAIAGDLSAISVPMRAHERLIYSLLAALTLLYIAVVYVVYRGDSGRIKNEEEQRSAAESANRAKSEFLAKMSHEIRTPMNGVLGMMELVLEGELTDKQRKCLELSKQSAGSLLTVINDILDVSKIEAGKLVLTNIAFSLRDCLQNTVDVFRHQADDKGVDLMLRIHPDVTDSLIGDPGRLRQILTNLVGNAMKFTERGWIAVDVAVVSKDARQVELELVVTDTGAGIPEDKQALVFEAFEQADGPVSRKHTGTGLGLAISTQLVEAMGGKITLDSKVGDGSTFRFTVVFGMGNPQIVTRSHDDATGGPLARCRALVVTASDANAAMIRQVLGDAGAHCTRIAWGEIAIGELDTAAGESKAFQVVLLDWDIQDMDGFELARDIREAPGLPPTPVVMLTSVGLRGDASKCVESGIAAYLAKPFDRVQLLEAVTAAIESSSEGDTGNLITRHTLREHQGCFRVLVAEDNYVNREHVTMLLENWGHTVICAENGRQAVAGHADESFDLILMDMEMPEMDGLSAARAIRTAEKATGLRVPIIAMTANVLDTARQQCNTAGMDGYVSKPMSGQSLQRAIEDVMSTGSEPAGGEDHAGDQGTPGPSPTGAWDAEEALRYVEGNPDALRRLITSFLANLPKIMAEIRLALEKRDDQELRKLGHKFKGSLGLMGAVYGRMLVEDIETAGRNADWPDAVRTVAMLDKELAVLQVQLGEFVQEEQTCEF
ncbi:MAG: response regulator [Phycisphaerae bacterium]|nr:response regulator [Phycisphaerae bacterium]